MKFVDRSKHILTVLKKAKSIQEIYKVSPDDNFWYNGLLNENWEETIIKVEEFLTQYPMAFSENEIKKHINRSYDYAEVKEIAFNDCYHYYGSEFNSNNEEVTGIRINYISPLISNMIYPINLVTQRIDDGVVIEQINMDMYYDVNTSVLSLQESCHINVDNETVWKYNFNPQKVRKLTYKI